MKQIGRTGLALAGVTTGAFWLHNRRPASEDGAPPTIDRYDATLSLADVRMAIVHGTSVDRMVRAAISELGGITKFVRRGDVVLVKPNVAFDRGPSLAATTHPDTVRAVVSLCREAGARKVIVADNPINSPEGAFYRSGVGPAAEEAGADVLYPWPDAFRDVRVGGEVLRTWPVFYGALRGVTRVIGVAPTKDHNLCGASMTLKNWYGLLGGGRNRLHQKIHEVIADLGLMITPTLVFLDARSVLMTNGPTGGSLADVARRDTVVCGVDPVAVDAYGATLLGRDPAAIAYLQKAEARGIGRRDWRSVPWRELAV